MEVITEKRSKIAVVGIGYPHLDLITLNKYIEVAKNNGNDILEIEVNGKKLFEIQYLQA